MMKEFLQEYGLSILSTILLAVVSFIGAKLKNILSTKEIDATKEKVVKTCVKAVEQLYKDLSGAEKLEAAKSNIIQMLNAKGIEITDLELDMMIESVVAEFNLESLWGWSDKNDI